MFFEKKVGNPFRRDENAVSLLKDLNLLQAPGPLPGRLEELNKLTSRFGLGEEWMTDWKLAPSQTTDPKIAVDKRPEALSAEELKATIPVDVPVELLLKPTVKREVLDQY